MKRQQDDDSGATLLVAGQILSAAGQHAQHAAKALQLGDGDMHRRMVRSLRAERALVVLALNAVDGELRKEGEE